jgi:hypothetical protein
MHGETRNAFKIMFGNSLDKPLGGTIKIQCDYMKWLRTGPNHELLDINDKP